MGGKSSSSSSSSQTTTTTTNQFDNRIVVGDGGASIRENSSNNVIERVDDEFLKAGAEFLNDNAEKAFKFAGELSKEAIDKVATRFDETGKENLQWVLGAFVAIAGILAWFLGGKK